MVGIADTLLAMGNRAEARRWIDRVARCRPTDWILCIGLSVFYERLGQMDKSIRWAVETARLNPNNPAVSGRLAQVYFAAREFEKAAEACEKAISLFAPDTLHSMENVHFVLGESYRHLGNERRARAAFRQGIKELKAWLKAGYTNPVLHYWLAQLHAALGNVRAARAAARRALAHPSLSSADRQTMERLLAKLPTPPRRSRKTS
jgi:tetratricopeptide (TPR) repeat protein